MITNGKHLPLSGWLLYQAFVLGFIKWYNG